MTYGQVSKEQARLCCKRHGKKCAKCPLRRERTYTDEKGIQHSLLQFCTYVLLSLYDDDQEELTKPLLEEEIQHPDEWNNYIDSLESEE